MIIINNTLFTIITINPLQVRSINHDSNEVVIDIPEGRYDKEMIQRIHKVGKNSQIYFSRFCETLSMLGL